MSTTHLELISNVLDAADPDAIQTLLDDTETVFWVDWRDEDDAIPGYCESILETGTLSAELVNIDSEQGFEIYISYNGKRAKVPLTISPQDRHITICSLNEILRPDYEVRFVVASNGSDTLAFLPLPAKTWTDLENQYGSAVHQNFYIIKPKPNLFTDPPQF